MTSVETAEHNIELFTAIEKPYGKSYGAWTAEWWRWVVSLPKSKNPLLDETGKLWNIDQPLSDVWFLAGCYGQIDKSFPHRKIQMQHGRSILFPVLNCEANPLEYPELKTHNDLIKHVTDDVNTIIKNEVYVNGGKLTPARIQSDPRIFKLTINKDNIFETKNFGETNATADGYWIFLRPLPIGKHTISFEGSCEFGRLNSGADYELEVV